jgi:hypothetical protein
MNRNDDGSLSLVLSDGTPLELDPGLRYRDGKEWRKRAMALNRHIVTVPENKAPLSSFYPELLTEYAYIERRGKDKPPSLSVALIRNGEITGLDYGEPRKGYALSYDNRLGYKAIKIDGKEEEDTW